MTQHNLTRNVFVDVAMAPVAAGTGDTQNGLTIDTLDYESIVFLVYLGALSAGAVTTIQVQYGALANGTDMANIANGAVSVPQASGSNLGWLSVEVHRPTKRYMRVVVTRATANAVINGASVLMGRGGFRPPTIGVSMGNVQPPVLVSP
jgi:hypothetical protein